MMGLIGLGGLGGIVSPYVVFSAVGVAESCAGGWVMSNTRRGIRTRGLKDDQCRVVRVG